MVGHNAKSTDLHGDDFVCPAVVQNSGKIIVPHVKKPDRLLGPLVSLLEHALLLNGKT